MECELLSGLAGAVIGGIIALAGSIITTKMEHRHQRKQDWKGKQYDLFYEIVELLMRLLEFSRTAKAPLAAVEEVHPVSSDDLWSEITNLRKKIVPRISILFDLEMENVITNLCDNCAENPNMMDDIEKFIEETKKKYFPV